MKKIITILLVICVSFLLFGCEKDNGEKIELDSELYGKSEYVNIKANDFKKIKEKNFLVFTSNSFCTFEIPCDSIFKEVMDKYKIKVYSLPIHEMKKTYIYDTVKYAPSFIVISNKKIVAYLDAESDEDYIRYQDSNEFEKWLL